MKYLVCSLLLIIPSITIISAVFIDPGATLVGPREPGTLVKGPSSKATVKGPSGPIIVTAGDTGAVSSGGKSGGIVSASGQTPGIIASSVPLGLELAPLGPVESILPVAAPEYVQIPIHEPALEYSEKLFY